MYRHFISPKKHFQTTEEELRCYSPAIDSNTTTKYPFPHFRKVLMVNNQHPQNLLDTFFDLAQFIRHKSA